MIFFLLFVLILLDLGQSCPASGLWTAVRKAWCQLVMVQLYEFS